MIARYRKALAALLGAATPAVVVAVLGLEGIHVNAALAGGIGAALATAATILAPANTPVAVDPPKAPLVG